MLQEFLPERRPTQTLGTGTSVCFMCEDALALYREFKSRGIRPQKRAFVGNHLWVVPLVDTAVIASSLRARPIRQKTASWTNTHRDLRQGPIIVIELSAVAPHMSRGSKLNGRSRISCSEVASACWAFKT